MPQFDPANFAPQFAWLVLLFAVLYFGVVSLTLPRVGRMVEGRETIIKDDIATAEGAKAEADAVRDAHAAAMARTREQAHATIAEAQAKTVRTAETQLHEAHAAVDLRIEHATGAIAAARTRATSEIARIATEAAIEIVERVTGDRPDQAAASAAVVQAT